MCSGWWELQALKGSYGWKKMFPSFTGRGVCACTCVILQNTLTDRLAVVSSVWGQTLARLSCRLLWAAAGACRNPRRASGIVVSPRGAPRRSRCELGLEKQLLCQLLPPSTAPPSAPVAFQTWPDLAGTVVKQKSGLMVGPGSCRRLLPWFKTWGHGARHPGGEPACNADLTADSGWCDPMWLLALGKLIGSLWFSQ